MNKVVDGDDEGMATWPFQSPLSENKAIASENRLPTNLQTSQIGKEDSLFDNLCKWWVLRVSVYSRNHPGRTRLSEDALMVISLK